MKRAELRTSGFKRSCFSEFPRTKMSKQAALMQKKESFKKHSGQSNQNVRN